ASWRAISENDIASLLTLMSGCAASNSAMTFSIAGLVVASAEAQLANVIVTLSAADDEPAASASVRAAPTASERRVERIPRMRPPWGSRYAIRHYDTGESER